MKNFFRLLLFFTVLMILPQITFADNPEKPTIEILQLDDNELVSFENNFVDLSMENKNELKILDGAQVLREELDNDFKSSTPYNFTIQAEEGIPFDYTIMDKLLSKENQLDKILQSVPDEMDLSEFEFVLNKTEFDKISHLVQDNTYKNIPVRVFYKAPKKNIYLMPKSNSKYF